MVELPAGVGFRTNGLVCIERGRSSLWSQESPRLEQGAQSRLLEVGQKEPRGFKIIAGRNHEVLRLAKERTLFDYLAFFSVRMALRVFWIESLEAQRAHDGLGGVEDLEGQAPDLMWVEVL